MVRALEGQREKRGAENGVQKERAVMAVHGIQDRTQVHFGGVTQARTQLYCVHVASPWTAVAFDPGSE